MRIVAIDPGPHVGVSFWASDAGDGEPLFQSYEQTPDEFAEGIEGWVSWADVVVAENFLIGGSRASSANETIEMIGVIRYFARRFGKRFVLQTPSDRKFADNAKLKRMGWWIPSSSDHARESSRHLMTYLARNDPAFRDALVS